MIDEFGKFISENHLINPADRILLAVSGGIDSMVMAHLFLNQNYHIGIAHCNFALRAAESDKDEELVRKFAADNQIPFFTTLFPTKKFAAENKLSVQMAARDLRYAWFEEIRKKNGYDLIAVAHNLNDNIETLLINLTRGTGLAGMTGIKPVNNRIIRPLLFALRDDIIAYHKENNIEYREDKSNAEVKYTRNKIRHQVIPVLREINQSVEITLNETAGRFSGYNEIVSEYISGLRAMVSRKERTLIMFNINKLEDHLKNKAIVYELFRPFGVTGSLLNDLLKVIDGKTGGQIFTGTHRIIKNRKDLVISGESMAAGTEYIINDENEFKNFPGILSVKNIPITKAYKIPSDPATACLDLQKLVYPVIIRRWKAGDQFYPLGMNRKKKLSDYFIDKKYSLFDKENIFILESGGKIAWIIGDRIDNRFRITSSTKNGLLISSK